MSRTKSGMMVKLSPFYKESLVKGTNLTGSILVIFVLPFDFSTNINCWASPLGPTGMIILPPSFNCETRGGGIFCAAAVTMIASKGAFYVVDSSAT
jgi:hypothetical protein